MRVLITGAAGFAGRWTSAELARRGATVAGTRHVTPPPAGSAVARWIAADLASLDDALRAVREAAPDAVLHLAGQPRVGVSFDDPAGTLRANVQGTLNVLEAARREAPAARCVLAGSCEVYGSVPPDRLPLREGEALHPVSPYAVSKAAAELLGLAYHRTYRLRVTALRLFNHTGPGQAPHFVCADFARQIARAEAGRGPAEVVTGSGSLVRDFLDVRDVAAAYADALAADLPGGEAYNVASGRGVSIGDVLDRMRRLARVPVEVREDPSRVRSTDVPALVGDATRFRERTGWAPRRDLGETLRDLLEDARAAEDRERRRTEP